MDIEEYNPNEIIEKKYHRGLLAYGWVVNIRGFIVDAVSKEEFEEQMKRHRDLEVRFSFFRFLHFY